MKKNYTFFDRFIFRTPLYSYSREEMKKQNRDAVFDEALYLASPDFYRERHRNTEYRSQDSKLLETGYKYLSRATTRCTPFGLFAGCSVGQFDASDNNIIISERSAYRRVTRLDMNYLSAIVQYLESHPVIRSRIKYFPNDSIYELGGKLRYVEYYYDGIQRIHRISSVDPDEYLNAVIDYSEKGRYISELVDFLVLDDIDRTEATEYIEELISSQLLKNELELCVTGEDALSRMISQLSDIPETSIFVSKLQEIKNNLQLIDSSCFGQSFEYYEKIIHIIREFGVIYETKYLFQTDMFKPAESAILNGEIKQDFSDLIHFLNKITLKPLRTNLSEFRKAFYERYEDREMPLSEVLDCELGIGFVQNDVADVPNELLRGVLYKRVRQPQFCESESRLDPILLKKYIDCIQNRSHCINLDDSDLMEIESQLDDLPATMYLTCSIMTDQIYIKSIGGSCGANLLGRSCHIDPKIEGFAQEIAATDQQLNSDAILAEIVHLPESRTGNVLFRPILREYEIHYLAASAVESRLRIPVSDLMISVRGERIVLRSKHLDREIIPRLTTAHDFSYGALPVYQFLCEMQTQNLREGVYFTWRNVLPGVDYFPRVEYKKIILSREKWLIKEDDFKNLAEYLEARKIPECVVIADNDKEQYIDFTDKQSIALFCGLLRKRKSVWVEEFLFTENNSPVKDISGNNFCNEFIFVCYKNK